MGVCQTERVYAYGGGTFDVNRVVCSVLPASAAGPAAVGGRSAEEPSTTGDTPQGLCDMSGNAGEWCSDCYSAPPGGTDTYCFVDDQASTYFVVRGGVWSYDAERTFRCAYRSGYYPDVRNDGFGFRLCRR
jgi:formylglycine-generating enzyme required for sulfatase activity